MARNNPEVVNNLNYYVNQRIRRVTDFYDFSFLRQIVEYQLVEGQKSYSLPQNFKNDCVFYLRKTNAYKPLYVTTDYNIIRRFSPEEKGEPAYVLLGQKLFSLFPTPDKEYVLHFIYYAYFSDLVNDTDSNYFTETFPQLIIDGVCSDVFSFLFEYEQSKYYEEKFMHQLMSLKRQDVMRQLPDVMYLGASSDVKKTPIE